MERLPRFGERLLLKLLISLCTVLEELFFALKHRRTDRESIDDFVSILEHCKKSCPCFCILSNFRLLIAHDVANLLFHSLILSEAG